MTKKVDSCIIKVRDFSIPLLVTDRTANKKTNKGLIQQGTQLISLIKPIKQKNIVPASKDDVFTKSEHSPDPNVFKIIGIILTEFSEHNETKLYINLRI